MSMAHQRGIHQLLVAEKKAIDLINDAKKRRAQRLKQAKFEAQDEIESFRQHHEMKFSDIEKKYTTSKEDIQRSIEEETVVELRRMEESVNENKEFVLTRLLDLVCDIRPVMHHNFLLRQKITGPNSNESR